MKIFTFFTLTLTFLSFDQDFLGGGGQISGPSQLLWEKLKNPPQIGDPDENSEQIASNGVKIH